MKNAKIDKLKKQADIVLTFEEAKKLLKNLALMIFLTSYAQNHYYTFKMEGIKYFVK